MSEKTELPSPEDLANRAIENQKFDVPVQRQELVQGEQEIRAGAYKLAKDGMATVEYEREDGKVIGVKVKGILGDVVFYSKDPADIEQFLELEIPHK